MDDIEEGSATDTSSNGDHGNYTYIANEEGSVNAKESDNRFARTSWDEDSLTHSNRWWSLPGVVLLTLISLTHTCFAVIAIGGAHAAELDLRWSDFLKYENTSDSAGFLVDTALKSWRCFAGAILAIFAVALAGEILKRRVHQALLPACNLRDHRIHAWIPRSLAALFALLVLVYRPPTLLPTSDILFDAFSTAGVSIAGKVGLMDEQALYIPSQANATLYGRSNIFEKRVSELDTIKHVFVVSMESADELAWPYSPDFCIRHDCKDIAPEYNNPQHMTPFYQSLVEKQKGTFHTRDYKTHVAYSTKSLFAVLCGQLPEYTHFIQSEHIMDPPLPCLPDVLRAFDPSFKSANWLSQDYTWDHYGEVLNRTGLDTLFGRDEMEASWTKKGKTFPEMLNWFGYGEDTALPFLEDWMDERLNNSERMFVVLPGNVMHYHFDLPKEHTLEEIHYSDNPFDINKYLNTVRWTDKYLELFYGILEKKGLLENSMIIFVGDHGPRLDKWGWAHGPTGRQDSSFFKVPMLIHAPGLEHINQPSHPFVNSDLLPTILDALGVDQNLIARYHGHSVLRARGRQYYRDIFHTQNPGGHAPQVTRVVDGHTLKTIYFPEQQDYCSTDLTVDVNEDYLYCIKEGWSTTWINDKMQDGISSGMYEKDSIEATRLMEWVHEGAELLKQHFATNAQLWDHSKQEEHLESRKEFMDALKTRYPH